MKHDSRSAGVHFRARGRMAVHTIWDYITRPIAKTIDDVPWCAEAISSDWLTAVLCRGIKGARVTSVEICGGDQGSSVRRNLKATYNEEGKNAGLPEHLFCKTTPTVLTRLATGLSAAGEARFYRQIRPELNIEAPICYHSAWDRNSGRSVHLFNDVVATKAACFCRWQTPISRQQVEQIVDTLAAFHSRYYDSARFTSDLKWVRTVEDFFHAGERVGLRECHERAMMQAEASSLQTSIAVELRFGLQRLERWRYTAKGHARCSIPMCTSGTGTSRERAEWGYVTGNVLAPAIGHGMFHMRYPQR